MKIEPGSSTAFPFNLQYRIDRIERYVAGRDWLDLGCADGGYSAGLVRAGAKSVTGVEVEEDRVLAARSAHPEIPFLVSDGDTIPFPDGSFDGVLMNEVFEHVASETVTLAEVHRVLRDDGILVVISPNRWFPFEGHRLQIGRWSTSRPTPFVPWLPKALTDHWVTARNFWPGEMRRKIEFAGFEIIESGFIMPVLEAYPWMPESIIKRFRERINVIDRMPVIRRFGVSNIVIGRRTI